MSMDVLLRHFSSTTTLMNSTPPLPIDKPNVSQWSSPFGSSDSYPAIHLLCTDTDIDHAHTHSISHKHTFITRLERD